MAASEQLARSSGLNVRNWGCGPGVSIGCARYRAASVSAAVTGSEGVPEMNIPLIATGAEALVARSGAP
jgi:hypothetical protein